MEHYGEKAVASLLLTQAHMEMGVLCKQVGEAFLKRIGALALDFKILFKPLDGFVGVLFAPRRCDLFLLDGVPVSP